MALGERTGKNQLTLPLFYAIIVKANEVPMEENTIETNESIRILILESGQRLISKVEEVVADIGEPDCKLEDPYLIHYNELTNSITLEQWLSDVADQQIFLICSDKILTVIEYPKSIILKKYKSLIKK